MILSLHDSHKEIGHSECCAEIDELANNIQRDNQFVSLHSGPDVEQIDFEADDDEAYPGVPLRNEETVVYQPVDHVIWHQRGDDCYNNETKDELRKLRPQNLRIASLVPDEGYKQCHDPNDDVLKHLYNNCDLGGGWAS